jgi:predicted Zn-dependent peptidase
MFKNLRLIFIIFFFILLSVLRIGYSLDLTFYDWDKVIDYKRNEFEKSWNNFLDTNFFAYNLENSKFYSFSVICKYGLKDENLNLIGIRFFVFYLIKEILSKKIKKEGIYFKDELIVNEDYIGFNYTLFDSQDVKNVYKIFSDIFENYDKIYYEIYNLDLEVYKNKVEREIKNYYEVAINPVLFFFKQQVFIAHPYYYLPYGNYNNIKKITLNDIKKMDFSKLYKFFILIGPEADKVYQDLFKNQYLFKNYSNHYKDIFYYNNFNNFRGSYDYSNYRFIDIKKTRVLNFYIQSKNSYDIFLFSVPSFYQNYKEYLAMLIIDNLLCDNLVGIFYKDLREDKGIIYSLYSFYPTLFLTSYYLIIFVSDSSSSEFKVFYTARNILENMDKQENVDDEINTAKIRIINKIYLAFDNPYILANSFVYSLLYKNKSISPFYLVDNLYYLDNQYIKQVAKKYLNNFWVFRLEGGEN